MISLSSPEPVIDRVLTSDPKNLKSIDVDIRENKIYWSEINLEGGMRHIMFAFLKINIQYPLCQQNCSI